MPSNELPTYRDFLFPLLQILQESSGSLTKRETDAALIERVGITDEQLAVIYPEGSKAKGSKILHRMAFARSSLKLFSAIDNSSRGVWAILPLGRELLEEGEPAVLKADYEMRRQLAKNRQEPTSSNAEPFEEVLLIDEDEPPSAVIAAADTDSTTWQQELLSYLQSMSPRAFERLCAQILREAGCEEVEVTQYVGDDGIDGVGLLRMGLLTFPVYFQAKRYSGTVGPDKVRELRGALAGRADKGILITTGRFGPQPRRKLRGQGLQST